MEEITALDLLRAMIRQAPEAQSRLMDEALEGYLDAYHSRAVVDVHSSTRAYRQGYFACAQHPMTLSARMSEILGLQSIMILLGREHEIAMAPTLRTHKQGDSGE